MAKCFYDPTGNVQGSIFVTSLPTPVLAHFLKLSYSNMFEMLFHYGFYLHFSGKPLDHSGMT